MAYTPPTYAPSGSIFGTTAATTPYTYGNLLPSTSSYNIWGSKGNPYITASPTYTPGSGAPIVPRPVAPVPRVVQPVDSGGDSAWTNGGSSTTPEQQYGNLQSWIGRDKNITRGVGSLFGAPLLDPAIDFAYGINPVTQKSLSWYDGSTDFDNNVYTDQNLNVNDYNAAIAAYDLDWQSGMTDLNQNEYVNQYLSERGKADATAQKTPGFFDGWFTQDPSKVDIVDKSFGYGTDNPNGTAPTNNGWGSKGFTGDLFNTSTGRGLATPATFGSTNTPEAIAARAGIATQQANLAALQAERNASPTNGFTPTDTITGDTGSWTNPAAGTDTSTLGGATGTTTASVSWSDNTDSGGNTTGTFTSDEMGTTGVTDYGSGQYSIDVGEKDEVGWEDPGGDSSSSDSGGDSKIICTAMNADYGFGSYRNAIWLRYAALNFSDKPEMELGYHALVLPMLKIRKKWYGKPLYAWLKHVAVHRTADLKAEMYGKERDRIGQVWRFFLEPLCYVTGILINKLKGDK